MKLTIFLAFVLSQALFAGLAWIGGYDFDRRGVDVFHGVAASICLGMCVALFASVGADILKDLK